MKILSPINSPEEVESLARAGADEFYCGVMPQKWREGYTNVASPNRREWSISNLADHRQLARAVKAAHSMDCRIFLALNAFYTEGQYPGLYRELDELKKIPVDALIVADPGAMGLLRSRGWNREIHVSTGAVVLNSVTARLFHRQFGVTRVVLPRHLTIEEIETISEKLDFLHLECFVLNSGCKNMDGFCTYHHGVNEILHGSSYTLPKKLGLDYHLYRFLRCLPGDLPARLLEQLSGRSDSACLLNWDVKSSPRTGPHPPAPQEMKAAARWVKSTFGLWSGLDPCGACAIPRLCRAGIKSLKIVGRENPTNKKLLDVKYLRKMLNLWESGTVKEADYPAVARREYQKNFGAPCREWCYYPEPHKD